VKIEVIKKEKGTLEFYLEDEDHTFANLLIETLHRNKHVKFAAYSIDHPILMARKPRIRVVTDGRVKPEKVLEEAAQEIFDTSREALNEWKKVIQENEGE